MRRVVIEAHGSNKIILMFTTKACLILQGHTLLRCTRANEAKRRWDVEFAKALVSPDVRFGKSTRAISLIVQRKVRARAQDTIPVHHIYSASKDNIYVDYEQ